MESPVVPDKAKAAEELAAAVKQESAPSKEVQEIKPAVQPEPAPAEKKPEPIDPNAPPETPAAPGAAPAAEEPRVKLSELTGVRKRAQEAEALAAQRAAEAEYYKRLADEASKPKPKEFFKEPSLDDYADPEEYKKDFEAYHTARISEKIRRESVAKTYVQRCEEVKKETPDFDEAVNTLKVNFSQPFNDALIESDTGPQIVYHLAKNQAEAMRLSNMTIGAALIELGEIRAKLKNAPKPPEPKILSQAPNPTRPVIPGTTEVPDDADDPNVWIPRRRAERMGLKV